MFALQRVMFECVCERMFLCMYASVVFLNKLLVLHAKKACKQLRCEHFIENHIGIANFIHLYWADSL